MPLALSSSTSASVYKDERDFKRIAELNASVIVGADHVRYRISMPLGSALGDDYRFYQMAQSWAVGADISSVLALVDDAIFRPEKKRAPVLKFPVSDAKWLLNVNCINSNNDLEGISSTIKSLMEQLRKDPASVAADLEKIELPNANAMHLVAILRSLFGWRNVVGTWRVLRDRAESEFQRRNLKPAVLLRGLLDK